MKRFAKERPVSFGLVSAVVLFVLFLLIDITLNISFASKVSRSTGFMIDSSVRCAVGILSVILLGYVLNMNGFKFAFSSKNFSKGLLAGIPLMLYMLTYIIGFFDIAELNKDLIPAIPAVVLNKITVGFLEEAMFRGLLITAFLIKFGKTKKGRIIAALISAVLFGLGHTPNVLLAGGGILEAITQGLIIAPLGLGFAAMYIYSKNLVSCMLLHTLLDIAVFGDDLVARYDSEVLYQITNTSLSVVQFLVIPVISVILILRAKPFENYTELKS